MYITSPSPELRRWLELLGAPLLAEYHLEDKAVEEMVKDIKLHHRHENMSDEDVLHRALGRLIYQKYTKKLDQPNEQPALTVVDVPVKNHKEWLELGWKILVLVLLALIALRAHGQIDVITTQNQGVTQKVFAAPFKLNCTTNMSCSVTGNTFNLSSSSTASTAFSALTASANSNVGTFSASGNSWDFSATTLFKLRVGAGLTTSVAGDIGLDTTTGIWHLYNNIKALDEKLIEATNLGTSGQPCLSNADGTCTFADPIVSQATAANLNAQVVGNIASGAADSGNPVKFGGIFNTTQPTVLTGQRVDAQMTARGAQIVGTGVDVFHVTVDSAPTTPVTGTFFQATQPISSTQFPVALDGSGFFKVHEQGTATIAGSVTANAGTGNFTVVQPTGTNLHIVCDSGCSSSTAPADSSVFTEGTTSFSPVGGYFQTSPTSLTTGHMGAVGMTATRHLFVNVADALPPGANNIGSVNVANTPNVNIQANATTEQTDGTNVLGTAAHPVQVSLANTAANATAVKVDNSAVTQPVSGTVTANAGTGTFNTQDSANGATASAVPARAMYHGLNASGNLTGQIGCDKNFILNAFSTSGSTQEVALSSGKSIYICGFAVNSASTTAVTVKLVTGTGANCVTGPTDLSIAVPLQAIASNAPVGQNVTPPSNVIWSTPASQELCVNLSAAQAVNLQVWYTQF